MLSRVKTLVAAMAAMVVATTAVAQDTPRVVTVNYALQYFAERLVGEDAQVVLPVPAGVDPSFWRPSIADISSIQSADLIVLNGAGFATWVDRVSLPRSRVVNSAAAISDRFIVTDSITHSHGDGGEHSHEGVASYTWLDPELAIAQAEAIAAAIAARDLAPAAEVYSRFDALRSDLERLDRMAKDALGDAQSVAMIATHPRYQYFARRYGLSISALEWEAGAMPDAQQLEALAALVQDTGARVLIWEAEPPGDAIEAARALGLRSVVFDPLAHDVGDQGYVASLEAAVTALSDAVRAPAGN